MRIAPVLPGLLLGIRISIVADQGDLLPQDNKVALQLKALTGGSDNRAENLQIPDL